MIGKRTLSNIQGYGCPLFPLWEKAFQTKGFRVEKFSLQKGLFFAANKWMLDKRPDVYIKIALSKMNVIVYKETEEEKKIDRVTIQWVNNMISELCDRLPRWIDDMRHEKRPVNSYTLLKKLRSFLAYNWQSGIKNWWNYYQLWLWQIGS